MKQKALSFEQDQDLHWEDLPPGTRKKILELICRLLEQTWKQRREAGHEPENHS